MSFYKCALFIILTLNGSAGAAAQDNCNLSCRRGNCTSGPADFSDQPTYSDGDALALFLEEESNNMHCECPTGWTGLLCEREYLDCNNGNHRCYHGGACIPGNFGDDQSFCDCREAHDDEGNQYFGKYCEIKETNLCSDGNLFCLNNSTCVTHGDAATCDCLDGYFGESCEYRMGSVPDCDLNCLHGGKCRLGFQDYNETSSGNISYTQSFWDPGNDYKYCDCKPNVFGEFCEINSVLCGDRHCFNGGGCVIGTADDGSIEYNCNCTAATTDTDSYAGRHCQYEATAFCDKVPDQNGLFFCTNGGSCPLDDSATECDCIGGFHGAQCEFSEEEENGAYEQCETVCLHNGECRKGSKDHGSLIPFLPEITHLINDTVNENFEHCECPDDYAGVLCEYEFELCGDRDHVCFNGAPCVSDGGEFGCDCEQAPDVVVGKFCEYRKDDSSTIQCPSPEFPIGTFCVNGATCSRGGGDTGYCACKTGYTGEHCELLVESDPATADNSSEGTSYADDNKKVVISCVVMAALGLLITGFTIVWTEMSKPSDKSKTMPEFETTDADTELDGSISHNLSGKPSYETEIL